MNDGGGKYFHVVCNKPNERQAGHRNGKINLFRLIFEHLHRCCLANLLGVLRGHVVGGVISHSVDCLGQINKFTVAVIDQLDQTIIARLRGRSVIKHNLQKVNY